MLIALAMSLIERSLIPTTWRAIILSGKFAWNQKELHHDRTR